MKHIRSLLLTILAMAFSSVAIAQGGPPEQPPAPVKVSTAELREMAPVVLPLHPRTAKRIGDFGFQSDLEGENGLKIIEPVSFFRRRLVNWLPILNQRYLLGHAPESSS